MVEPPSLDEELEEVRKTTRRIARFAVLLVLVLITLTLILLSPEPVRG